MLALAFGDLNRRGTPLRRVLDQRLDNITRETLIKGLQYEVFGTVLVTSDQCALYLVKNGGTVVRYGDRFVIHADSKEKCKEIAEQMDYPVEKLEFETA